MYPKATFVVKLSHSLYKKKPQHFHHQTSELSKSRPLYVKRLIFCSKIILPHLIHKIKKKPTESKTSKSIEKESRIFLVTKVTDLEESSHSVFGGIATAAPARAFHHHQPQSTMKSNNFQSPHI